MSPEQQERPGDELSTGYLNEKIDVYALGTLNVTVHTKRILPRISQLDLINAIIQGIYCTKLQWVIVHGR